MVRAILVSLALLFMTGCTMTEQGAAIGGATGAAIGAATTGTVGGTVAGGVIGGLAGALIGRSAEAGTCIYQNRWGYRYYAPCP